MPEAPNAIYLLAVLCLGVTIWIVSILLVLSDLRRRSLPAYESFGWMVLVCVFPFLGFAAYVISKLLVMYFGPALRSGQPITQRPGRPRPARRVRTADGASLGPQEVPRDRLSVDGSAHPPPALSPAERTSLILEISGGPQGDHRFVVTRFPARIGRDPDVEVCLAADEGVSPHHAEIYRSADELRIRDLRDTGGTQVNGFNIDDKVLEHGDQIRVHDTLLLVTKAIEP